MKISKRSFFLTAVLAATLLMACNTDPYPGNSEPAEVSNLKVSNISAGNGCEVTFTWDEPLDSSIKYVVITYDRSLNGNKIVTYVPSGMEKWTFGYQKTDTVSNYLFQTQNNAGTMSEGISFDFYVPTARDLDVTYVSNGDNLNALLNTPGYYFLKEDIVLSNDGNPNWTPVKNFSGVLYGNGHSISNVTITGRGSSTHFGFFSETMNDSVITDLVLKNIDVTSNYGISGTLAGFVNSGSRITNCGASGTLSSPDDNNAGGLLGYVNHTSTDSPVIQNCFADVNVVGYGNVGGFAGHIHNAKNCYAVGKVEDRASSNGSVGGFAGEVSGSVSNCYSAGTVSGTSGMIYGFAGNINGGSAANCYYNLVNAGNGITAGDNLGSSKSIDLTDDTLFAGFDFTSVWSIDDATVDPVNKGMPYLTGIKPE